MQVLKSLNKNIAKLKRKIQTLNKVKAHHRIKFLIKEKMAGHFKRLNLPSINALKDKKHACF